MLVTLVGANYNRLSPIAACYLDCKRKPQIEKWLAMIVISCQHESKKKHGHDRKGNQRFRCLGCGKTWVEETTKPIGDMRISMKDAAIALGMLLEGMSIRATCRLTGLNRHTINDLILLAGENCQRLLDSKIQKVEAKDVQADEIWSFVGMKEKQRVARNRSLECGDSWTFIAIERETKLILAHKVGQRDNDTCWSFLLTPKRAIGTDRFQLTTDGLRAYTNNVPFAFGMQVDFAQLIKSYSSTQEQTRYSPATIISAEKIPMFGSPDDDRISTSHIERFNLTVRMHNRRHTRLTNAHSKSLKHHVAMQAIFVAWYNFCRKHETLKGKTPAMASGLADDAWTICELLESAANYV
jgi:transposase-like protein/IS1 family transposase